MKVMPAPFPKAPAQILETCWLKKSQPHYFTVADSNNCSRGEPHGLRRQDVSHVFLPVEAS